MNWALLGPELDELKAVLYDPLASQAPLGPYCSICSKEAHSMPF